MNYPFETNYQTMKWNDPSRYNLNHGGLVMSRHTYKDLTNNKFVYPHDARTKDGFRGIETELDTPANRLMGSGQDDMVDFIKIIQK